MGIIFQSWNMCASGNQFISGDASVCEEESEQFFMETLLFACSEDVCTNLK